MSSPSIDFDVIVVGAGLAGLTTATHLHRSTNGRLKVLVLEAKDRVGGRTYTTSLRTGGQGGGGDVDQWDLGGQWVGNTQYDLLNLLSDLHIDTYEQYTEGEKLGQIGGTKIRPYSDALPINTGLRYYSPLEAVDFALSFTKLESLAAELSPSDPYAHPLAVSLDEMTLASFARRQCYTRTMVDSLDLCMRAVLGCGSEQISLLYVLLYGRAAGGLRNLLETSKTAGAQNQRIKGGAQPISRLMTEDLPENTVHLGEPVVSIDHDSGRATVHTRQRTAAGEYECQSYTCRRVVLASPPHMTGRITFTPPLPFHKQRLFDSFPAGNLIKFICTYRNPFWRDDGLSGEIVSTGLGDVAGEMRRPIMCTFDGTTSNGNAALVGFFHNEWSEVAKELRQEALIEDLVRFFGPSSRDVVDYEDIVWAEQPFNGGCPVGILQPGNAHLYARIREVTGCYSLHFAGTETSVDWPGYMTGAVQSGIRAAHECLSVLDVGKCDRSKLAGGSLADDHVRPREPDFSYNNGVFAQENSKLWTIVKPVAIVSVVVGAIYIWHRR